jgi:SAM-dependent methyltransferase
MVVRVSKDDWLEVIWDFAAPRLPAAPASVIEIGCGKSGGLVPPMTAAGYQVVGVDPKAPEEPGYVQIEFEQYRPAAPADVIVASLSLHHVADLDIALDHMKSLVRPGGLIIVAEWARERFDEPTARWVFDRLPVVEEEEHRGWLHYHRDEWPESGLPWDEYLDAWATEDGLLRADQVITGLDARFDRVWYAEVPFLFGQFADVTQDQERAAIDAGQITPLGVQYVARAG